MLPSLKTPGEGITDNLINWRRWALVCWHDGAVVAAVACRPGCTARPGANVATIR
jgi:hypothetical protein